MKIILRKFGSLIVLLTSLIYSKCRIGFIKIFQEGARIGKRVRISPHVVVRCTDGGFLDIGNDVSLGFGAKIICQGGELKIGRGVYIGPGCIIVCRAAIAIGDGCKIAEYAVIRDQDHRVSDLPIAASGFLTSAVWIGENCWVGAKASILRGSSIGEGCVVGAHALVKGCFPQQSLILGVPARRFPLRAQMIE